MRGSVESPFEAQLQETVAMELNTGESQFGQCPNRSLAISVGASLIQTVWWKMLPNSSSNFKTMTNWNLPQQMSSQIGRETALR